MTLEQKPAGIKQNLRNVLRYKTLSKSHSQNLNVLKISRLHMALASNFRAVVIITGGLSRWDLNISCQLFRPDVFFFFLGSVDGDKIRERRFGALLSLGIPIKHDLDLDTKYTLS